MRRVLAASTLLAALLGAPGCATQQKQDALRELQESVEAYNEAYRWKNYERAVAFIPADLRAAYLAAYEDDDNSLHIEDYQLIKLDLENDTAAQVTVRVRYMLLPSVSVEKQTVVQHWHRVNNAWILETEDNPIRDLDPAKTPKRADAFGGQTHEGDQDGDAKIEARGPGGQLLRKDADDIEPDSPGEE